MFCKKEKGQIIFTKLQPNVTIFQYNFTIVFAHIIKFLSNITIVFNDIAFLFSNFTNVNIVFTNALKLQSKVPIIQSLIVCIFSIQSKIQSKIQVFQSNIFMLTFFSPIVYVTGRARNILSKSSLLTSVANLQTIVHQCIFIAKLEPKNIRIS